MRKVLCIILLLTAVCSCGFDRFGDPDFEPESAGLNANADIGMLRTYYTGQNTIINGEFVFDGRVTANDLSGNFFRTFIVDDDTGAVEVNAGFYDLHNTFTIGRRVVVKANGLGLGSYNGVLQIGRTVNPYSAYRVESFEHPAVMAGYVVADDDYAEVVPVACTIASLSETDCGRLVKIAGLTIKEDESGLPWAYVGDRTTAPEEGVRTFADAGENEIAVVTSGYASFADQTAPSDEVSLTGIVMYGKFGASAERFALKIRNLYDVEEAF